MKFNILSPYSNIAIPLKHSNFTVLYMYQHSLSIVQIVIQDVMIEYSMCLMCDDDIVLPINDIDPDLNYFNDYEFDLNSHCKYYAEEIFN